MASLKSTMDELGLLTEAGKTLTAPKIDRTSLITVVDSVICHLRDGKPFTTNEPVVHYNHVDGSFEIGSDNDGAGAQQSSIEMEAFTSLFSGDEYGENDNGETVVAELNDGWIRRYILSEIE